MNSFVCSKKCDDSSVSFQLLMSNSLDSSLLYWDFTVTEMKVQILSIYSFDGFGVYPRQFYSSFYGNWCTTRSNSGDNGILWSGIFYFFFWKNMGSFVLVNISATLSQHRDYLKKSFLELHWNEEVQIGSGVYFCRLYSNFRGRWNSLVQLRYYFSKLRVEVFTFPFWNFKKDWIH